ncbi:MAG: hypothetical protein C4523_16995 [Myxococcales bacterium]|nr:MAG: hypothetical protein C4523_16995 [Myxococcales bacterium]
MKRKALTFTLAAIALLAFGSLAQANETKAAGTLCFTNEDGVGFSETITLPGDHFLTSVVADDPADPLGDYVGFDDNCGLPKSKAVFPTLMLTDQLGYTPDPAYAQCPGDGEIWLAEDTYEKGYKLFLLDAATCDYRQVMELDIRILDAPVSNWCPFTGFAFEFNHAVLDNFIGSQLLEFYAAQPECPLSWGMIRGICSDFYDIGAEIKAGHDICTDAEITQLPGVACSGCEDCGVESNGRMATAMARRHYLHGRSAVCSDPTGEGVQCDRPLKLALPASSGGSVELTELLPDLTALDLKVVPSTPSDLVEITNAVDMVALDHFAPRETDGVYLSSGALLLVETRDEVYEHTKTVCDRVAGEVLSHITTVKVRDMTFPVAVIYNPRTQQRSYAISLSVADGAVYARWRLAEYPKFEGLPVYNAQLWACSLKEARKILEAQLDRIESVFGSVAYDAVYNQLPESYIMTASKLGDAMRMNVDPGAKGRFHLEGKYWPEQDSQNPREFVMALPEDGRLNTSLEGYLDAQVKLVDADGVAQDEVYVSDGSFTAFDDAELGDGHSAMERQINVGCVRDSGLMEEGDLPIHGCASMKGQVDAYAVITRTLAGAAAPYDLSRFGAIRFSYRSTAPLVMCLESASRVGMPQSCITVPASSRMSRHTVNLDSFKIYQTDEPAALSDIAAISWNVWSSDRTEPVDADFAVQDVTITAKRAAAATGSRDVDYSSGGCASTASASLALFALLMVLAAARRATAAGKIE